MSSRRIAGDEQVTGVQSRRAHANDHLAWTRMRVLALYLNQCSDAGLAGLKLVRAHCSSFVLRT